MEGISLVWILLGAEPDLVEFILGRSLLFRITYIRSEKATSLQMDSKPVRVVFLTEREDEATQCRVQG